MTTSTGNATVTVNDATTYQTFNGFGGAFNEAGWKYLSMLSPADQTKALTLLFDANNGAHFMYGRIPIGASDYALARYTEDEMSGDYTMANFSITQDQQNLIPYVKAALAINSGIHLWGSPWTPPTWMKTGPYYQSTSTAFDGGNMKSDAQTLQAFALYLAKWVLAYKQQGLTIEVIMAQNEPNYAQGYPSCLWSSSLYNTFVKTYLAPTFQSQSVSAQIFLGTMSQSSGDGSITGAVTGDSTTMQSIKGFGMQWTMANDNGWNFSASSAMTATGLPIWQTEHQAGNYPWSSTNGNEGAFNSSKAPNNYGYGIDSWGLIKRWLKVGVSSYSAWNMVLDTKGTGLDMTRNWPQDALLVVDTSANTLTATPAYYVFRHFSQYVQPGAKRVATSGSLDTFAFKNPDNTIVTVLYNSGSSAAQTVLSVGGTKLQFTVPANGFATVVK